MRYQLGALLLAQAFEHGCKPECVICPQITENPMTDMASDLSASADLAPPESCRAGDSVNGTLLGCLDFITKFPNLGPFEINDESMLWSYEINPQDTNGKYFYPKNLGAGWRMIQLDLSKIPVNRGTVSDFTSYVFSINHSIDIVTTNKITMKIENGATGKTVAEFSGLKDSLRTDTVEIKVGPKVEQIQSATKIQYLINSGMFDSADRWRIYSIAVLGRKDRP